MFVSDEVINLGSTSCKFFVTVLENVDGTTLGIDVKIELGSIDKPFSGNID